MQPKANSSTSSPEETVHNFSTLDAEDKTTQSAPVVRPSFTLKLRTVSLSQSTEQHAAVSRGETSAHLAAVSIPGKLAQPRKSSFRSIAAIGVTLLLVIASVGVYLIVGTNTVQKLSSRAAIQPSIQPHDAQSGPLQGGTAVAIQGRVARGATGNNQKKTQQSGPNGGISPYIFGVNLGLFDTNDQFLNSAATRNLMQQMHVRMVRMPVRTNLPMSVEIQTAQDIKSIGAAPLVILRSVRDPNFVADNVAIVQAMNQVFGNGRVYYEFGNEDDLAGISVDQYLNAWNMAIPQIKPLASNAVFIGPVNYQYNRNYLATFLQNANPQPDMISWHEYTCSYMWTADLCLAHIDNWTTHINDARSTMQSTIGQALPILITEWNYASDQLLQSNGLPFPDGKYNNAAFITAWTTKALQTLAANHVFASMQYSVTNTALPMIAPDSTSTMQGMAFQSLSQAFQAQTG